MINTAIVMATAQGIVLCFVYFLELLKISFRNILTSCFQKFPTIWYIHDNSNNKLTLCPLYGAGNEINE